MKIAIIGHGFVGKAVDYGFPNCEKVIIDPIYNTKIEDLKDAGIDAVFISVPTPMGEDGSIDSSIVESCFYYLEENLTCPIILKSTVTPDVVSKLVEKNEKRFVYNPEFLTERNANRDFVEAELHIFGGNPETVQTVIELYLGYSSCDINVHTKILRMSAIEASFVKYGINNFLTAKVVWFNQLYDIIQSYGDVSFETVRKGITADSRIGISHSNVPGHDGRRGFSGACFPKDAISFLRFTEQNHYDFSMLREVIKKNQEYRSNLDLSDREIAQKVRFNHNVEKPKSL